MGEDQPVNHTKSKEYTQALENSLPQEKPTMSITMDIKKGTVIFSFLRNYSNMILIHCLSHPLSFFQNEWQRPSTAKICEKRKI